MGDAIVRILITALLLSCGSSPDRRPQKGEAMTEGDPLLEPRHEFVQLVLAARAAGFHPLPRDDEALADRALFGSLTWTNRVFRGPIDDGQGLPVAFRPADAQARADLLEHRLTVGRSTVSVYEGSSFFVALVPATGAAGGNLVDRAADAANALLKLPAPAKFVLIEADTTSRAASTDPQRPAGRLGDWTRRIDAVSLTGRGEGNEFALVIYKATFDDMMTLMSDPAAWFEDQLRTARKP